MGNDLQPSRLEQRILELQAQTQELIELATPVVLVALAPGVIPVTNQSNEILPAVPVARGIVLSHVGNQEISMAINFDAVVNEGFILRVGGSVTVVIPAGDTLNAIATGGGGSVAFQDAIEAP